MAKQTISIGAAANDGTGDGLRSAGQKINANFTELYGAVTIIKPPYRPQNYGATFDGVTDDTPAWTSMLSALVTAGGGEVLVPPGTSRATLIAQPTDCYMRGAGRGISTIQRFGSGTGPLLTMSGASSASRCSRATLEGLNLDGNMSNGPIWRSVYSGTLTLRDMFMGGSNGPGMQFVEVWDSYFSNLYVHDCGIAGTTSADDAAPTGSEVLQFYGAIASSGHGYSTENNNLLTFDHLHLETFKSPAIIMARGLSSQATSTYGVRFNNSKFEAGFGTFGSQYLITLFGFVNNIHFLNAYFAMPEQVNPAFAANTRIMLNFADSGIVVRDSSIFNGGTMDYLFHQWTGGRAEYQTILVTGNLPTGAAIFREGGTTPFYDGIVTGSGDPLAPISPVVGTASSSAYHDHGTTTGPLTLNTAKVQKLTMGVNTTISAPSSDNAEAGSSVQVFIEQGGTARTVTWTAGNFKWPGGTVPTLTASANATDLLTLVYDGTIWAASLQKGFA